MRKTWLKDTISQITAITETFSETQSYSNWVDQFRNSSAYSLCKKILKIATTSRGLSIWFPGLKYPSNILDEEYLGNAFLYTPKTFEIGSSLSHVDASFYDGEKEFLMRPFGTPRVLLQDWKPISQYGVLGEYTVSILRSMGWTVILNNGRDSKWW